MNPSPADALRRAEDYLQAGKPQLAQSLLTEFVRQNPASERGWLLLSQAVTGQSQKIDCLQRVLRINPANAEAQTRLTRLLAPPETPAAWASDARTSALKPTRPQTDRAPARLAPTESSAAWLPPSPASADDQPANTARSDETDEQPEGNPDVEALRVAVTSSPVTRAPKTHRKTSQRWILVALALVTLVTISAAIVLVLTPSNQPVANQVAAPAAVAAAPTATPTFTPTPLPSPTTFPPTWTPTPPPTATPTRTPTSYPTPNAQVSVQMDKIEQQVSDLRGLSIESAVPRVLIRRGDVESTLKSMVISQGYLETLPDQARSLSALGLIKPTYDLVKYALNGLADNIGGFYVSWLKQLFVIGTSFHGLERFVFSHEYDHVLTDQHFDINGLGVYPNCLSNGQRCEAIRALVEGDATLLMQQWLKQYASPQDYLDLLHYQPPGQTLPEDFPPPYVSRDLDFPYEAGLKFVEYLYARGNWATVDKAYASLPDSTEQILHPEKYLAGEKPIEVAAPPLTDTLGSGWRLIDDNELGEWTTYLILASGADVAAQQKESVAFTASRGWGGDHYQIYYNDTLSQTVLAAEWAWDTPRDATEFRQAMFTYLDERFRGAKIDRTGGQCWESNHQTSCIFLTGQQTRWLLAPDLSTLNAVQSAYPDFQ